MSSIIKSSFLELNQAIQFFEKDDPINGTVHFNLFYQSAIVDDQLKASAPKVYRKIETCEGQPNANLIKSKVLDAYLIQSTKKEIKRIASLFRSGNETAAFAAFNELFQLSQQIPQLKAIQDFVYFSTWVRMGEPTSKNQPEIAHPDFGRLAFHNRENRHCSSEEKADALDLVIRIIDYSKLNSQLVKRLPKDETYYLTQLRPSKEGLLEKAMPVIYYPSFYNSLSEEADNYFRKKPSCFHPLSNHILPQQTEGTNAIMEKLFAAYQGICFGECHYDYFIIDFLHTYMDFFKDRGVKTLFMELFWYDSCQTDLDAFNRGGELSSFLKARCANIDDVIACRYGEKPYTIISLMKAARERGIKIIGIDITGAKTEVFEKQNPPWNSRIKSMNYAASKIINKEKGNDKFIVLSGKAHLVNSNVIKSRNLPANDKINSFAVETLSQYIVGNDWNKIIRCAVEIQNKKIIKKPLNRFCQKPNLSDLGIINPIIRTTFQSLFQQAPSINELTVIIHLANYIIENTVKDSIQKTSPGLSEITQCPSIDMVSIKYPYRLSDLTERLEIIQLVDHLVATKEKLSNANFTFTEKITAH